MVSEEAAHIIYQNTEMENFIPIKIIKIKDKGYGVIATTILKPNTLLCSYLGCMGTNENIMPGDDSQFSCGYLFEGSKIV